MRCFRLAAARLECRIVGSSIARWPARWRCTRFGNSEGFNRSQTAACGLVTRQQLYWKVGLKIPE
jgi:hypothetical protein